MFIFTKAVAEGGRQQHRMHDLAAFWVAIILVSHSPSDDDYPLSPFALAAVCTSSSVFVREVDATLHQLRAVSVKRALRLVFQIPIVG